MAKCRNISRELSMATCVLLAGEANAVEEVLAPGEWDVELAFLAYQEKDRVSAYAPVIAGVYQIDTEELVSTKLVIDSLTGASANGAVPSLQPQVFTRPSGNGEYSTDARKVPLDDTYEEERVELSMAWFKPIDDIWKRNIGFAVSSEPDYFSLGVNGYVTKDMNRGNTTLSLGASYQSDKIEPKGGVPVPLSVVQDGDKEGTETKKTKDILFGVTQIIDRYSLFQVNYTFSSSDGYLTDPYKLLSVVDGVTGDPLVDSQVGPAIQPVMIYESRPGDRKKHALFGMYKRYIREEEILETSYRISDDNFGISSHTLDFRYKFPLSKQNYIRPHLRLYKQSKADFFQPYFVEGREPVPGDGTLASADYRLNEMTNYTIGFEYGKDKKTNRWSVAAEYYVQTAEEPSEKYGSLDQLTLYPDVEAYIFRLVYDI